jgi:DNA-binding IclR family transcriptional regulator
MARSTPAVRYAAEMLEFLADDPRSEYTLSEIARAIGHNKASCSGILHTMEQSGLVSRHPIRKRYSVGPALIRLGAAANERFRVIGVASAEVTKLAKELGVEWNISAPIGGYIVELAASYRRVPFFGLDVGQKVPFVAPVGAVYIAWSSDEEIEEWIQRAESGPPDDAKRERHRQSAQAIRIRGYSIGIQSDVYARILDAVSSTTGGTEGDDGSEQVLGVLQGTSSDDYSLIELRAQAHHHVVFIAAPVFDAAHRVIGALTLLGFGAPLSGDDIDAVGQQLLLSAGAVSEALMGSSSEFG